MNNEKEKIPMVYNDASPEAEQRFTDHFIKWNEYKENRDQPVRFLSKNGIERNIVSYIKDSVDRFNEYFPKPSHKKDWQCVSEDTQILGVDGWKSIGEIKKGDKVLSFDITNNKISNDIAKDVFVYDVDGEMVSIKNARTDQLVTTNHRVIANKEGKIKVSGCNKDGRLRHYDGKYNYIEADKLTRGAVSYRLPVSGYYDGDFSIGEDWAELVGWMLTDGCMPKGKTSYIAQAKPKTLEKLRLLLISMGVEFREWSRSKELNGKKCLDEHRFYFPAKGEVMEKMNELIPDRKPTNILWRLPLNEKMRLLEGIYNGDGSYNPDGTIKTVSKPYNDFKEWLQTLLHLSGLRGAVASRYVNIAQKGTVDVFPRKHIKNVKYKGKVWSISTERTNYIARRNGRIFITGNSNTFEPITRDKIIAILGRMVSTRLSVGLELKSRSLIDMDQAEERRQIFSDLLQSANDKNDDDTARVWEAFVALSQGTTIGYESWKKEAREVEYVKEINPDTGEKKTEKVTVNKWDDVYGCLVPVLDFYPETIWVNKMSDVKRAYWVTEMKYTRFMDEFGKFDNADKVKEAGYYFGLSDYDNWGISQDVKSSHVEVIRFYDEVADKYGIWANGVEIYYGCMPWNHKTLPFWHSICEPINEDFFYGKSIADKLMSMQDLNNGLLNGMLDQLYLSLKSPIFISGEMNDDIRDGYLEPDRVYTAEQGTTVSKPLLGGIDQNAYNVLGLIKKSIESSSISDQSQGIATGGRKTRYEVQTLQEGALTLAGLFVTLLENSLKRKYWLRMKNIIQYYSMPSKDADGKAKFKFIILNDRKLTNGKIGKKMIEVVNSDEDLGTAEDLANIGAKIEGVGEYNPALSRVQPVRVTREWLLNEEFDFEMTIAPFSSVKDSETDRKNKDIQFYQLTNGDPMFDKK